MQNKLLTIIFTTNLLIYSSNAFSIQENNKSEQPIDIKLNAEQNISINGYDDLHRCIMYFGDSLKTCMETLSPEDFRQNFKALSAYNRRHYLETLTYEQQIKILKNFN